MSSTIQTPRPRVSGTTPQPLQASGTFLARKMKTLRGQFIFQAGLILLLAGIITLVGATSLNRASNDLYTIDQGSIPSVNYAQAIAQLVSQIDAQSADFLATTGLTSQEPCIVPTSMTNSTNLTATVHNCDERNIDAEIVLVNEQLFNAEHNVTYPGEQTAVERISIGLESYLGDIHQMRVDFGLAKSKTDPNDPDLQMAYRAYLDAGTILHDRISLPQVSANTIPFDAEPNQLPNCTVNGQTYTPDQWKQGSLTQALDCLSDINHAQLENAYTDSEGFLGGAYGWLLFLGLLFGAVLIVSTGRMMANTHRYLNPGLAAAALVAIILSFSLVGLFGTLGAQSSDAHQDGAFKQLVRDDYDSVYFAALLKRYATDANADESRWLIAQEFHDTANIQHWQDDWSSNVSQVTDLMQKASNNQTWDEEIQPLQDMKTNWDRYYSIDGQIRDAVNNQHDVAQAEMLSTGDSNRTFGKFADAVDALGQANQGHYDSTFKDTNGALGIYFVLVLVLFPLSGLLGAWGIWLRLKDF